MGYWTEVNDVNLLKVIMPTSERLQHHFGLEGFQQLLKNGMVQHGLNYDLNQARGAVAGAGSTPSALCFGGWNASSYAQTEAYGTMDRS